MTYSHRSPSQVTCSIGQHQFYKISIPTPLFSLDDLILCLCYVSIFSECCASDHWVMFPKPLFHLPFSSIVGMECYIAAMEVLSELFSASIMFSSRSSESHASPMLTAPFAGHVMGLLPLILESPCNGQFSI